ncbi:MAG: aldose epimerase family protein [Cyclobacteriaceae bacterium]|nr:galactose mutarotase [Cyclobacteriaceae bacterium]
MPNNHAGSPLEIHTLSNLQNVKVSITNFGGKVVSILAPDRYGNFKDIVLGYDTAEEYVKGNPYFGALIGRYGNRIAKGQFSLNGDTYQLSINSRIDTLHGGPAGFHNRIWKIENKSASEIELSLVSADGEEGYPGELSVNVRYSLNDANELAIDYFAETDKTTIVNLTNHPFFNLKGEGNGDILQHDIKILADRFTPVDERLIPTGEIWSVEGTALDFRSFATIGTRINANEEQITFGRGYDHNWVLDKNDRELSLAACVRETSSGRELEVWTTEPGLQFYSGNFLDGTDVGKGGKPYGFRSAFCLEAQHFPDSPNHPNFPSTILKPGEKYLQKTVYKFGIFS